MERDGGANLPVLPEADTKDADDAAKGEAIVKKSSSRASSHPRLEIAKPSSPRRWLTLDAFDTDSPLVATWG